MNTNNPITEIGVLVLAALLVIGGVLLLYASRIDTAFASSMFIIAAGLLGLNGALKSPSPAQETQLSDLQSGLQQVQLSHQRLVEQVLSTLPPATYATQAQPAPQPVTQPPLTAKDWTVTPAQAVAPGVLVPVQPHVADEFTAPLQAMPKQ